MKKINIIGKRYNHLTVIRETNKRISNKIVWEFKCDCGNIIESTAYKIQAEMKKSCGCKTLIDLTNQKFGKLIVIKKVNNQWECLCDCGNTTFVSTGNLKHKSIKSCGCGKIGKNCYFYKDGRTKNKEYAYDYKLQKKYGIDIKYYKEMLKNQSNRCLICFNVGGTGKQRLVVDHDHETGKVRGLLCNPCNRGLGYLKDSTDVLLNALRYLGKNKDGVKIAITLYENV